MVTQPKLASRLLCLPPILYMQRRNSISSCSKAPRGLSVLLRVTCIFTGTTISPSPLLRQFPDRYAFRAGRNLPDKEFRYLRTVIVTAAVYWGFNSLLSQLLLTFQHRAGVSTYISAFAFAGTCVCAKQSLGPLLCHCLLLQSLDFHNLQSSLFRSYGCNLPSSLTRVFSRTLEFSSCLPVSVLVRAHYSSATTFLGNRPLTFVSSVEETTHQLAP